MQLAPKSVLESIHIRFAEGGTVQGIAAIDKTGAYDADAGAWYGQTALGPAREITEADLAPAAIDPALAALSATVEGLRGQLAAALSAVTEGQAKIAALEKQLAASAEKPADSAPSTNSLPS